MSAILRQARHHSFWVLILSAYISVTGWALYLPGWIDADRFVAGQFFMLAVLCGGLAGVWLYAAAAVCLLGGAPTAEGGSSPVDAAGGLLALPGTSGEARLERGEYVTPARDIHALIEESSLGSPQARALRESVPVEVAQAIVERANREWARTHGEVQR